MHIDYDNRRSSLYCGKPIPSFANDWALELDKVSFHLAQQGRAQDNSELFSEEALVLTLTIHHAFVET